MNNYLDRIRMLSQEEILGLTIIGEARGESIQGQVAVGSVIRNRLHTYPNKYPGGYTDICLEPKQFSCWNENDSNFSFLSDLADKMLDGQKIDDPHLRQCLLVAQGIVNYDILDNTKFALNYLTNDLISGPTNKIPSWARNRKGSLVIGNQTFFTAG